MDLVADLLIPIGAGMFIIAITLVLVINFRKKYLQKEK
jgi:hypothetical protein